MTAPRPSAEQPRATRPPGLVRRGLPAMDLAVDLGFAVLLLVCGARYFSRHALVGEGVLVLVLAIGAGASYAVAVIGRRGGPGDPGAGSAVGIRPLRTRQAIGLLAATGFWLPLTLLAPSFGWCAFALFFAVHRVLRGTVAFVFSGAIVVAVSIGLLIMSKGEDLGLVLGPFFGGLVLTYAYAALGRAMSEQERLIAELIDTREQLARSEREAGASSERGRVASELHDTVVQRTASALLMLETDELRPGGSSPTVSEARETLREALVETRQLLHGLADPRTTAASLTAALRAQAEAAGAAFSVAGPERRVPEAVAHALQRIVQESLLNARKHAGACETRVALSYSADSVGVEVSDDGVGLPAGTAADTASPGGDGTGGAGTAEHGTGFGIRAMTWRAQSLGGTLAVDSAPGRGTVVAAVLPIGAEPVSERIGARDDERNAAQHDTRRSPE